MKTPSGAAGCCGDLGPVIEEQSCSSLCRWLWDEPRPPFPGRKSPAQESAFPTPFFCSHPRVLMSGTCQLHCLEGGHHTLCWGSDSPHPAPHSLCPSPLGFTPSLCLIPGGYRASFHTQWGCGFPDWPLTHCSPCWVITQSSWMWMPHAQGSSAELGLPSCSWGVRGTGDHKIIETWNGLTWKALKAHLIPPPCH